MVNVGANDAGMRATFVGNAKAKAMSMVDGAKKYFKETFFGEMRSDVAFYKICRFMNPAWAKTTDGNIPARMPQTLNADLQGLAWFDAADVAGMVREYPRYVQAARDSYDEVPRERQGGFDARLECIEAFWCQHKTSFPHLAKLVRYFYTFLPSSAMSERVFSMLKMAFSLLQLKHTLNDYVEGCIMLRYNKEFIRAFPEWQEWAPVVQAAAIAAANG